MNRSLQTLPVSPSLSSTVLRDGVVVLLASLTLGMLAQISIPIGPVPVTGQTLGVLAIAMALGARRGALAVMLYIAQGVAGLPVFAGGTAGFAVLLGPTAGYLVGFVPAVFMMGLLAERFPQAGVGLRVTILAAGTAVVYSVGSLWLSRFVGWERVVALGVLPFLFGDALKISIVALAASSRRRAPMNLERSGS
ncbi:MAG: biotin transporter BioY [Spirochaetota bacterium]